MSDTSPFGFGRFVPGFDFLQNLAKNASEGSSKMPGLSGWIAPTMSVEDVEKRVDELKAVQFWLEQNSRALSATIQALEVQKMTLSTLKGMNVSMGDMGTLFQPKQGGDKPAAAASAAPTAGDAMTSVAQAMTDAMARATSAFVAPMASLAQAAKADDKAAAPAPAPAAAPAAPEAQEAPPNPSAGSGSGGAGVVDPVQWWAALTQQFQQIATSALQDVAQKASLEKAAGMTQDAFKTATDMASQMAATGLQGVQAATGQGAAPAGKAQPAKKKPAAAAPGQSAAAAEPDAGAASAPASAPKAAPKAAPRRAAAPTKRARD